ncbi:hypothetical protein LVB77_14225 [Lysobacter sp. 5GHs7-4]|uniref:hypothetical protein n=1 Tax=Lysobacter sp. 5GHs7-4 TaxID=2904253 RepID=UPI001E62FD32|nr:hypothetical protein [Lysobacter sp. 5GHs7-4]UHQ21822.1 hypothetical protein LVB77_14225 [Lysobacter sp. 5GHs7-4]
MKRFRIRYLAVALLAFGLGFGGTVFAFGDDPFCVASCQEQLNDCRAQNPGNSSHCGPIYRACIAACDAQ